MFNVIGNCGADSTPCKAFFPWRRRTQTRAVSRTVSTVYLLEQSDSEDAGSEAIEEVVLEPPEHTAEAVLAGEAMRAEAAEEAAGDPLLLSAPTPALPVLLTIERKLERFWARLPRGREISREVARALNSGRFLYVEYAGVIYGLDPDILDYGDESEADTDGDMEA